MCMKWLLFNVAYEQRDTCCSWRSLCFVNPFTDSSFLSITLSVIDLFQKRETFATANASHCISFNAIDRSWCAHTQCATAKLHDEWKKIGKIGYEIPTRCNKRVSALRKSRKDEVFNKNVAIKNNIWQDCACNFIHDVLVYAMFWTVYSRYVTGFMFTVLAYNDNNL